MALKAYSFSENENFNAGVHDKEILEHERKLAAEFVKSHPCQTEPGDCPLCGSGDAEQFSIINNAFYARCEACWSLYVPLTDDVISAYRNYLPIKDFRASERYQEVAKQKRAGVWKEQLFWITFRTARYMAPLKELHVAEVNGRYNAFREMIKAACASLSSYQNTDELPSNSADIALYLGTVPSEADLHGSLSKLKDSLKKGGLIFLDSRVSTGFDILTLGGKIDTIFPYEHLILPSADALEIVLKRAGFEVLEISTPGTMDVNYAAYNSSKLDKNNLFARYLLEKTDESTRSEFQRFLQKNAISSYAQIVARAK